MPVGEFYAKWVNSNETSFDEGSHAVNEVGVYSFALTQNEGEFAVLTLVARNPEIGLLNPSRKQWLWFSQLTSSGVRPLFFGRVVGIPQDITGVRVTLVFRARPLGYQTAKRALAETLKVAPYYDPIWIPPENLSDPDVVLQARSAHWHIDRITHEVTISDKTVGEDGTLTYGMDDIEADSFSLSHNGAAKNRVRCTAEIRWTQAATGTVDITQAILDAFALAGSNGGNNFMIASYTGGALVDDWPLPGDEIGGGWEIADSNIVSGTNRWVSREQELQQVKEVWGMRIQNEDGEWVQGVRGRFNLWVLKPYLVLRYRAARQRTEIISFEMYSDIQALLTDSTDSADDDDPIELSLASNDVSAPVETDGSLPIGDVRRSSYINTDRGYSSLENLLCRARALLIDNARVVTMSFNLLFHHIYDVTLRKSVAVEYDMIPGGVATGKIIGYSATGDGDGGVFRLNVTVASCIGRGNSVAAVSGNGDYVDEDYVDDYQTYSNQYELLDTEDVAYLNIDSTLDPDDDGMNFFDMRAQDILNYVIVTNGTPAQWSAVNSVYVDIQAAIETMNETKTYVCFSPKRLTRGPFTTEIDVSMSSLMIPQQIDLEAAGI